MKLRHNTGILTILFSMLTGTAFSQEFNVSQVNELPAAVDETSGLVFINDNIITHNDSGDDAKLYEIDPENGQVLKELVIDNATNTDWEDITYDNQYIYIADIGNNDGDRTNLKIYLLPLQDYLQDTDNRLSVTDSILFSYADQQDFNPSNLHNFDAEAIISFEDSLYIFTKNWADQHTNIYSLPKVPGTYETDRIGRINAQGLITGAALNTSIDEIMLTGYTLTSPFLIRISDFENTEFHNGTIDRLPFQLAGSYQIEAIDAASESLYYLTAETNDFGEAMLLQLTTDFLVSTQDTYPENLEIYPNPTYGQVKIRGLQGPVESISLSNLWGTRVFSVKNPLAVPGSSELQINFDRIPGGIYHLQITTSERQQIQKMVVY